MNFPLFPERASEASYRYDALFFTIVALTILFTALVGIAVAFLAIRYRKGTKVNRKNAPDHNIKLEMAWMGIPLILVLVIFAWSASNFVKVRKPPKDAMEIYVVGKQWMWQIQHPNGVRENNEMHVLVGKPVKLTMISQDVIHAMYLPEFRAQYHVVPGRYTQLWFTPTKPGKYKMLCAMHCGTQHSEMVGYVYVLSPQDYNDWMNNDGNRFKPVANTMVAAGQQLFQDRGCANCHGVRDTLRAPTLNSISGSKIVLADGSTVVADEDFLRESIVNPYNKITKGYSNTMPSYAGQLTEEQILSLITYMKSLSNVAPGEKAPTERQMPATRPNQTGPQNATDIANQKVSAGAAQAKQLESKP